jgi:hypothetical protein
MADHPAELIAERMRRRSRRRQHRLTSADEISASATFTSVKVLIGQIRDYITHWNTNPTPFTWTATADEILAKVRLVQTNIKKLVDNNASKETRFTRH